MMLHYVLILRQARGRRFFVSLTTIARRESKHTNFEDKSLRGAEQKKTKVNIYTKLVSKSTKTKKQGT